ncbi:MAG TPA: hypothetical protein VK364_12985 [Hymenobacter sp.]|nr:hypothetical protein [Hymenobacter sp.]
MECLFLSPAPEGRRVCLYAVPDGVPLYFKHSELMQDPGYQLLWRGNPESVTEEEAAAWVARPHTDESVYLNYRQPGVSSNFQTARESFQSAVEQLGHELEYAPGTAPREVLVGEIAA